MTAGMAGYEDPLHIMPSVSTCGDAPRAAAPPDRRHAMIPRPSWYPVAGVPCGGEPRPAVPCRPPTRHDRKTLFISCRACRAWRQATPGGSFPTADTL